jgi:hypothetical protein
VEHYLEGAWGLHWWQFLFLIEGSSTVVSDHYKRAQNNHMYNNLSNFTQGIWFRNFVCITRQPRKC